MLGNVHPNMVMVALRDLIKTPLYKNLNVTIHHQWASLFVLHMNLKFKILTYNNASSDNSNFDNEKIYYTPTDSMIHSFLNVPKIMDCENTIYSISRSQNFHPLGLFLKKHLEELNFPTLFYGQPQQFFDCFLYQKITQ
jgi:hypothetical protein